MVKNEIELKDDNRKLVQDEHGYRLINEPIKYGVIEKINNDNEAKQPTKYEPEMVVDTFLDTVSQRLDEISKAPHYNTGVFEEVIEMAKKLFTPEEVMGFMKINSFKYRLRAGYKDDIEKDIKKALQYEKMYLEYLTELNNAKH